MRFIDSYCRLFHLNSLISFYYIYFILYFQHVLTYHCPTVYLHLVNVSLVTALLLLTLFHIRSNRLHLSMWKHTLLHKIGRIQIRLIYSVDCFLKICLYLELLLWQLKTTWNSDLLLLHFSSSAVWLSNFVISQTWVATQPKTHKKACHLQKLKLQKSPSKKKMSEYQTLRLIFGTCRAKLQ